MKVRLAEGLTVTPDIFTTSSAIIGIRGSGKTTQGVVLAEQAIKFGVPVAIIDPTGAWYGLKSSADGKSAGLPVYVFGGRHADAPLEATAGPIVARFIVERNVPIVLDLSDMTKGAQRKFVGQFCESLYDLKARARDPLFVIVDECARFCPQTMPKGDLEISKCVGAVEDIVALGRSRGLGCAIIGQRPATINNNVLTQSDNLFAMRTVGTADRKALDAWITEAQGEQEQRNELVQVIASLKQGEGYFWSPAIFGIFKRVQFDNRTTFDSSRTPKIGEKRIEPKVFADVDLDALSAEIRATVERAKADDPKELKKKIAELQKAVNAAPAKVETKVERVEVPVLPDSVASELREIVREAGSLLDRFMHVTDEISGALARVQRPASVVAPPPRPVAPRSQVQRTAPAVSGDTTIGKCERAILSALAQNPEGCEKSQLGILSGYSPTSGGFNNSLGKLRSAGFINRESPIRITDAGLDALGAYDPLPQGEALLAYWVNRLGKCEAAILTALANEYPHTLDKHRLGEATGYSATSGGFNNSLGKLRTLKLIEGYGEIKASDAFFVTA